MPNDRTATNPVLSGRKLKLGTFQTNLESGCCMSDLDGRLRISWPNTIALAKLAEEMDFDAIVPVARWRGFGGITNPQGPGFEAYTWASGIAASTATSCIASTSHVSLNHPITAAKQSAAIDHISNGRFMLNIVCGWNGAEMDMFGIPLSSVEDRYAAAQEWVDIVKRLWAEDDEFDFDGRFYQIKKGYLEPKPIQKPRPPIMNAGASELGRHFALKNCDIVFTLIRTHDYEVNKAHVAAYHKLAREQYGRDIRVWTHACVVEGETEKEAREFYDYYVHQKGDWKAAQNVIDTMSVEINQKDMPPERHKAMSEMFIAGWGGHPLVGSREQIVDKLAGLSRMGMDGVLLSWPRFENGMKVFRDKTLPLVKQAGLRDAV